MAINTTNRIIKSNDIDPEKQKQVDQVMQNNELVQLLLNQLNITANLNNILLNEKLLFILNESSKNIITLEGITYKKRHRNYETYSYLLEQNEKNEKFKETNPNLLGQRAEEELNFMYNVLNKLYGINDIDVVKRNFDLLQPIVHGEVYKMMDNIYSRWDYSKITQQISEMVKYSQRELKKELEKKDELVSKVTEANKLAEEQEIITETSEQIKEDYINDDGILIIQ